MLEVLQILEAEINLREDTRVTEQAKMAIDQLDHAEQALVLSKTQHQLQDRTEKVTQRIRELPEGEELFGKEIALLTEVAGVMGDAKSILSSPDTGSKAIRATQELFRACWPSTSAKRERSR